MNLCTDQLAMLVAAPGQLLSVSYLAAQPRSSAMAEEAQNYVVNHGLAEEIYLLEPDLVIAGTFSTRATVAMLKRLDIPVAVLSPAYSLDEVRQRIIEMGEVLHRQEAAEGLAAEFDARLAALRDKVIRQPRAALFFANGYTSGDRTLAGQILSAAGFDNIADEVGLPSGGRMPLEVLAMADPEVLIRGSRYEGNSRSEEILDHPVVAKLREALPGAAVTDRDWVCGTPFVLRAIEELAETRRKLETSP
nr:ABC transporter substrate-binding protein [Pseudoruegeria sp. HB172150]